MNALFYNIITSILEKHKEDNLSSETARNTIANEIVNEYDELINKKYNKDDNDNICGIPRDIYIN